MAYAPIPNIVTIHAPKIGCDQLSMNTLTEVLQSESVRKLLNRQNVYLQTPLSDDSIASDLASSRNLLQEKRNGAARDGKMEKLPELSVIPIMNFSEEEQTSRPSANDEHLLPSKNDGKSAIELLPLLRETRKCGHSEPCESLVCCVEFQRLAVLDDILPLVAENIEYSEIDATVSKHCDDARCDALSIDHDRCRRAVIRCNRCDLTNVCDICMAVLKTRKSQMMHKNCKMRVEYRHNRTSRGQLMKDRMRIRELQILDHVRSKKNDYTDPTTGHERAIECLQKNSELIVIPKALAAIQQHPTIRIASVSGKSITTNLHTTDKFDKFVSRYPLILPAIPRIPSEKPIVANSTEQTPPVNPTISPLNNRFIAIARAANFPQSINISDYLKSQTQTTGVSPIQPTSYFMPIRVVPIAGLKTEPSLLHHTQGVPKFCLVSQTPGQSAIFAKTSSNPPPAKQQTIVRSNSAKFANDTSNKILRKNEPSGGGEYVVKRFKPGVAGRRGRRRKNGPKRGSKSFECTFCFKRFSTDWYFKLHIAKHKGEIKFTCKYCKKPFMHHFNMTKHIATMHKGEFTNEDALVTEENGEILHCAACKIFFKTRIEMDKHRCPIVCLRCHARMPDTELTQHLRIKHEMSEAKAHEEFERQKRQRITIAHNRGKRRREIMKEQARGGKNSKDEPTRERLVERENGAAKRKRNSLIFNDARGTRDEIGNDQISMKTTMRRLTRRRKRNHADQSAESPAMTNDNIDETPEDETTSELTLSSITAETDLISR